MKKALSIILVLALAFACLAGCGKAPEEASAPAAAAAPKTADAPKEAPASASAPDPITITVGVNNAEGSPKASMVDHFEDEVDAILGEGRINWVTHYGGALGSEQEMTEMTLEGTLNGDLIGCTTITSVVPTVATFLMDCPYLFGSVEEVYAALEEWYQEILDAEYESFGFKVVYYQTLGGQEFSNNQHTVRTPEDMKGLKIRTYTSDGAYGFLEAVGALPTTLPFGEVYTGLQNGTIDGVYTSSSNFTSEKFVEVAKYHTAAGVTHNSDTLLFNLDWFNSLPADVQEAMIEGGKRTQNYMRNEYAPTLDEQLYKDMEAAGVEVTFLTEEEFNAFRDLVKDYCWDKFEEHVGEELWNQCLTWIDNYRASK